MIFSSWSANLNARRKSSYNGAGREDMLLEDSKQYESLLFQCTPWLCEKLHVTHPAVGGKQCLFRRQGLIVPEPLINV